ncbi:UbiA family prenyltransferase [Streptomyces pinistramenti]|uniref:UbiA family prenyltransferase n=1 Tax=Streptomyces pinistramenti TaxID=2884812 RepID=UPI001D098DFE|nr:UbiA family prenyltransferase [Streptomyces pinistramenti]MCB5906132.1 UbiA family prenyltransferase [Streptomyces pinistramenti]
MTNSAAPAASSLNVAGLVGTADPRWRTALKTAHLCWSEARPSVQLVFLLRFAVGAASAGQLPQAPGRTVLGLASWWCAVACAYLLNGVTDIREDRANGSRRPIARGALPVRTAAAVTALLAGAALALGATAGVGTFGWVAAFLLFGWAYSARPVQAKRSSVRCAVVVFGLGATSYAAGISTAGHGWTATGVVFGCVMAAWMALVGSVVKDLGDADGDAVGGRRTIAVVHGLAAARALAVTCAALVGLAGTAVAARWAPIALAGTLPMAIGALWVIAQVVRDARREHAVRGQRRGAYRAFMVTQYASNLLVLIALGAL